MDALAPIDLDGRYDADHEVFSPPEDLDATIWRPDDIAGHMWSDAAVEIRRASGQDVQRQAIDAAPSPSARHGSPTLAPLPFEVVIHAAAMDRAGGTQLQVALACVVEALELACG